MTAVLEPTGDVVEATPKELRIAARNALRQSGFSWDELRAQARSGDFKTIDARKSWMVLGGLAPYLDEQQEGPADPVSSQQAANLRASRKSSKTNSPIFSMPRFATALACQRSLTCPPTKRSSGMRSPRQS